MYDRVPHMALKYLFYESNPYHIMSNNRFVLLFMLLLCAPVLPAQHYIKLDGEKITLSNFPYHVEQTVDGGNPDGGGCIGFVQKGMNNRKVPAFLEKGISAGVQDLFARSLPVTEQTKPIVVRVNKLRVYEVTETSKEYGYVEVNVTFLVPDGKGDYFEKYETGTFRNETTNVGRWDITKAHGFNIAEALTECLKSFADREQQGLTYQQPVAKAALALHRPAADMPMQRDTQLKRGVYYTFADFRDNRPIDRSPYRLTGVENKEKGRGRMAIGIPEWENNIPPDHFWGFCDGKSNYVNIKGTSYQVIKDDSIYIVHAPAPKDGDAALYGVMFGLVGSLVAGAVENAKANEGFVYKIDVATGGIKPLNGGAGEAALESKTVFFASERNPEGQPAILYVDGVRQCELTTGSYFRLKLPPNKTEVNCCVEAGAEKECFKYEPTVGRTKYWLVSISKKGKLQVHVAEDTLKERIKDSIKDGSATQACPN